MKKNEEIIRWTVKSNSAYEAITLFNSRYYVLHVGGFRHNIGIRPPINFIIPYQKKKWLRLTEERLTRMFKETQGKDCMNDVVLLIMYHYIIYSSCRCPLWYSSSNVTLQLKLRFQQGEDRFYQLQF